MAERTPIGYGKLLRTYLSPHRYRLLLLSILILAGTGLQLYNPRILATFTDGARAGHATPALVRLALLSLALAAASQAVGVLSAYLGQDLGWRATNRMRTDLTRHCLGLDSAFHKSHTPGEMIERIDGDVSVLANFFSQFIVQLAANLLLLMGTLGVLFWIDYRAGLGLTLFALVNLLVLYRVRGIATPHWQASRKLSAAYFGFLEERLTGLEDIGANGAGPYILRRFHTFMRERLRVELKARLAMAAMLTGSFTMIGLGITVAFGLDVWLIRAGAITVGTALMIYVYTEQIRRPIEQILRQLQDLTRATASIRRVQELFGTGSALTEGSGAALPPGPLAVELIGVTFGYDPAEPVLHDFSLTMKPGQVLGLLGRTGSGKSTVARLLTRLHDPTAGAVCIGGVDARSARLRELRQRVGLVTQEVQLFAGTLRENLTLFDPSIPDEKLHHALAELGLDEWCRGLPGGLDTELAAGGAGLSAGEGQLVALARIFLKEPGLVILDEASARLDPATEARLEGTLDRLLAGRTAIVIAHRLTTLRRTDLIAVMEGGRLVEFGEAAILAADPTSRYARLLAVGLEEEIA